SGRILPSLSLFPIADKVYSPQLNRLSAYRDDYLNGIGRSVPNTIYGWIDVVAPHLARCTFKQEDVLFVFHDESYESVGDTHRD
ncbi:MAG: hypothetical protein ABI947_01415, partial [Chloroflexota bacterium]